MPTYNFGQEPKQPKEPDKKKKIKVNVHFSTNLSSKPPVKGLIFGAFFTLVPIIALILIYTVLNDYQGFAKTVGEIIDIIYDRPSDNHEVIVKYTVNNLVYENPLNAYSSSMHKGDMINIWYKIDNPNNIKLDDTKLTITMPTVICSVMIASGVGIETYYTIRLIKNIKSNKNELNNNPTSEGK